MNRYLASFDLHLHSYYSYDACADPEYYFAEAAKLGLRAIAITDHHNFDVLPDLRTLAVKYPEVGFFNGAELTGSTPFGTMDFVCLGLPWKVDGELKTLAETLRQYQIDKGDAISAVISKMGFEYTREERKKLLLSYRPAKVVEKQGITHVRNQLQASYWNSKGIVKDYQEWNEILWDEKTRYWEMMPKFPSADEIARIVHGAGGIVLIAHPNGYFKGHDEKRMDALREFVKFDGIECAHPSSVPVNARFWHKYCEKHHLLSSGGTDLHSEMFRGELHDVFSHGWNFAEHLGQDRWLDELCERIPLYHGKDL